MWAQHSWPGRISIVFMIVVMVLQAFRVVIAMVTGDWSDIVDIFTIFGMAIVALIWVQVAGIERSWLRMWVPRDSGRR
jgi:hypothetical protein